MFKQLSKIKILNFIILFFVFIQFGYSQIDTTNDKRIRYTSKVLYTTEELGTDFKILIDSVFFYHENSEMSCDSAIFNTAEQVFDAYGNIKIIKPNEEEKDTVFLFGDTLHYNGQIKMANVRNNVILIKDSLTLTTDSLDYDLKDNIGYYSNGGRTINGKDTLTSVLGYYYSDDDEFFFKDSVVVKNPKFIIYTDTLKHNTKTETSYFLGATEIIGDENYIYCEDGWYNHKKDISQSGKNSYLQNKEHKIIGDSLFYDRNKGVGEAFKNVIISDTINESILIGNYGYYNEKTEFSLLTDSAVFVQVNEGDSLYLHADTLMSITDTLKIEDEEDRIYKIIKAFHHTKIFKSDFQAKCDSLVYDFKDSTIQLYEHPVVWSDSNQMSADFIKIFTVNNEVEHVEMKTNALMASENDSTRYNQTSGDKMIAYIEKQEIKKVDVLENGKSIYFALDDQKRILGVNKIECKNMLILFENQEIDKIWFYEKPKATMHPPLTLSEKEKKFDNFTWFINFRPLNKDEIFIWDKNIIDRKEEETPKK